MPKNAAGESTNDSKCPSILNGVSTVTKNNTRQNNLSVKLQEQQNLKQSIQNWPEQEKQQETLIQEQPNSLYPTIIERNPQVGTETVSDISKRSDLKSAVGKNAFNKNKKKVLCTTLTKRRSRKAKPASSKITTRENLRLSTLRARIQAPPIINSSNKNQHKDSTSKVIVSAPAVAIAVPCYLHAASLNKIEILECEVPKKTACKRKRLSGGVATARKHYSERQQQLQLKEEDTVEVKEKNRNINKNIHYNHNNKFNCKNNKNKSEFHIPTTKSDIKRLRVHKMSLYEQRFPNNDDASGGRVAVGNGYVSSSTRTSSASSGNTNVRTADPEGQQQEIVSCGNFYTPTTSVSSLTVTGASVLLGNGSVNNAPSMATLCNIGNTCYLNSVVYTLRFAPQFLHNLHHLIMDLGAIQQHFLQHRAKSSSLGRGITATHMDSVRSWSSKDLASMEQYNTAVATGTSAISLTHKSGHQALTERLHELYQCLRRNEMTESTDPFHADTLLHAVQDVSAIFEGNQQQDAHEFLMCVLNSIRETCQTLLKSIAEYPDIILNGCISSDTSTVQNNDIVDAYDKATVQTVNNYAPAPTTTKSSLFSRKSKRKEESKNSKNSRLQSPLKDVGGSMAQQQQPTANSLFYLNMVDLSGASNAQSNAISVVSASKSAQINANTSDEVCLLKDKERLSAKLRELSFDFFSEDFEGVTVSTTKCLSCETVTEQKESMIDIAVPVPISGYDNAEYTEKPSAFIQNSCITREYFRGENKYRCEQCTGYTEAIRSISYEVLPRLLVIQLSRFSGGMEKINSYIPTSFTLQCFCAKCCALSEANKLHIYKLYSVITHVGATMSVGHYIAYTCSLDWSSEYANCPKDRRAQNQHEQQSQSSSSSSSNNTHTTSHNGSALTERLAHVTQSSSSAASAAASAFASSTNLIKKMKFVRSKASSSGDMSKNMKNLNGITSKSITNGIGNLSMNTTCQSVNCCATRQQQQQQPLSAINSELNAEALQNGSNQSNSSSANSITYNSFPSGYGSTGRSGSTKNCTYSGSSSSSANASTPCGSTTEPIWYMCDDDKIKAMTQREFEELLSPSRKITITPYLLFYARFNLQQTSTANTKPTVAQSTPQSSWSSESLQSGSHKM